jgi:leucyl/phenylalanyl-tRNA--protein transferase
MNARIQGLEPDVLIAAYSKGFFPMADHKTGSISWYSPDPRAVIPLNGFHVPRTLRRILKQNPFEIRVDTAFKDVIKKCSDRKETWISSEIIEGYSALHVRGFAHSVESWNRDVLMGGLYGVAIGGAFFGESMFSLVPNASKIALVHLVQHLQARHFLLLDTQFLNRFTAGFGATEMPRAEYLRVLRRALYIDTAF